MSIVIVMLFIVLDFITGIVMAIKNNTFNSSIMRDGLFNKFGEIVIVAVAFLIDYGQTYLDMGFSVPVLKSICVYIILMEIGSILENVSRINKSLVPEKIREILEKAPKK
nr:MAG TPA: holin [Caudoviricetes sp.]